LVCISSAEIAVVTGYLASLSRAAIVDTAQSAFMVIAYMRDELFGLCSYDVIPARATRKAIFSHHLWQPAPERKQSWWKTRRASADKISASASTAPKAYQREHRSPGTVARFGLLNAQSVGNSSTAIVTVSMMFFY